MVKLKEMLPKSWSRKVAENKRTRLESALKRCANRGVEVGGVIDVGASDGRWSEVAMAYFPTADYLLVEANALHQPALERFCDANPQARFVIAAATDTTGEVAFDASDLFGGQAKPAADRSTGLVPAARLDDLADPQGSFKPPYLLKLDTHGHEVPILNGAERVVEQASLVIIETYMFQIAETSLLFHEMVSFMREKGFGVTDMSDPLWRTGDRSLWQIDFYFQPLSDPLFQRTGF